MNQHEKNELEMRIADLRAYVTKMNREMRILLPLALLLYVVAAIVGNTSIGWAFFVAAVAVSFYVLICQTLICQQNALAEIFERGVSLPSATQK